MWNGGAFGLYPRTSRRVGYRRPSPQAFSGLRSSVRVPHVRTSVRGPKTMGEALRHPFVPDPARCSLGPKRNPRDLWDPQQAWGVGGSRSGDLGHPLKIRPLHVPLLSWAAGPLIAPKEDERLFPSNSTAAKHGLDLLSPS